MDERAAKYFYGLSAAHQLLAKNLLLLGVVARYPDGNVTRFVYSGFVVEVEGAWFWVTAGHVIQELVNTLKTGAVLDKSFFAISPHGQDPIDCPYDPTNTPYADQDGGRDYAIQHLSEETVDILRRHTVEPIHWKSVATTDIEFERYNFVGCLAEYQKSGEGFFSFIPAVLIMDRLPDDEQASGFVRYRFDVSPSRESWADGELKSIVGMSGGPVFGYRFREDGETLECSCIAIQSSWDSKTWVSYACPLRPALNMIRASFEIDGDDKSTGS